MSTVHLTFLPTFNKLVTDPKSELDKFIIITPSHEKKYSADKPKVAFGLASGAFSLLIFTRTKPGFLAFFSIAVVSLYYSIVSKDKETAAFKAQVQEINNLFNPSIQGLKDCYEDKANTIYDAVHGTEVDSIDKIAPLIQIVINIYDRTPTTESWTGKAIKENPIDDSTYKNLKTNADALVKADAVSTNPTVIQRFKDLQEAADLFLNGKKKTFNMQHVLYVSYAFGGQGASIFLY